MLGQLYALSGNARVVGITGPPGCGKSTLVEALTKSYRGLGLSVGILAVDPTSPYTGGALLGDRVRMQALATDSGVFIRSMATRGAMGGLALATRDSVDLLDAAGYDRILVETVGVGQDEVDVIRTVDEVIVVTVPGLGDEIQAIKAGIMEIADIFVVNKADRPGAELAVRDLRAALEMAEAEGVKPPILTTVASEGDGVDDLRENIEQRYDAMESNGDLLRRRFLHLRLRVENILQRRILAAAADLLDLEAELVIAWEQRTDPYTLADRLFAGVLSHYGEPGRPRG